MAGKGCPEPSLSSTYHAVYGAMTGLSSFIVGSINTKECYVPISLVANKRNVIDTDTNYQSLWEMVVFSAGQPSFQTDIEDDKDAITTASGGKSI